MLSSRLLYTSSRASSSLRVRRIPRILAPLATQTHGRSHHHHHSASMATTHDHDPGGDDEHHQHHHDDQSTAPGNNEMVNNFTLLGLPTTFQIDEQQLKSNYLKIMVESHPDKLASSQASLSGQQRHNNDNNVASYVTKAFDVLQKPHTRAIHLLELQGKPLEESSNSELVGMEFLLEIMELRETIQATTDNATLQQLRKSCRDHTNEICQQLAQAFAVHDLDRALTLTAQLQYWNRVDETIRDKADTME